jgi:prevent-host-death family protein
MATNVSKNVATVGARELKTRLGGYLREVQRGKVLTITERGIPVARLSAIVPSEEGVDSVLEDLALQGLVRKPTLRAFALFVPVAAHGTPVQDAISHDREDRI